MQALKASFPPLSLSRATVCNAEVAARVRVPPAGSSCERGGQRSYATTRPSRSAVGRRHQVDRFRRARCAALKAGSAARLLVHFGPNGFDTVGCA
eukprot:scaffold1509_cov240-Pinguiococcus_pyrenoidosus.AAC.54